VTQTNVVLPLHVDTIDSTKDIKLCCGQLEANLARGTQIFLPISVAKFGNYSKISAKSQLLEAM
jgi:hypothetical protein